MRFKLRIWPMALVIIPFVILGGVVWRAMPPKEPVYEGKTVRYWLSAYDFTYHAPSKPENPPRPTKTEANEAVFKIGTNAIPTLMRMLSERDSSLKRGLMRLTYGQHFFKVNWQYRPAAADAYEAKEAFEQLGPQTADLVPQLTKIYDQNPNGYSRQIIVAVSTFVAPHAEETVPLLMRALADTNDFTLRGDAAVALAKIHVRADLAVPALTGALADPEDSVRMQAAGSLAFYGAEARATVPALLELLDKEKLKGAGKSSAWGTLAWGFGFGDVSAFKSGVFPFPRANPYRAAAKALWKIDPAAAESAGLKQKDSNVY